MSTAAPASQKSSGAWLAAEGLATAASSFLAMVITARLIGPDAVGLSALALAFVQFAAICTSSFFQDALVQRPALTPRHHGAAFVLMLAVAALGYALVYAAAPGLATLLEQPELAPLARLAAPSVPCMAITGYVSGLRMRQHGFRAVALRLAAGNLTGAATGIVLAMRGFGAEAPALQVVAACGLSAALMLTDPLAWPNARPGLREAGEIMAYGGVRVAHQAVYQSYYRAFVLAVGTQLSAAALGQLHLAFRLVDQTRNLIHSVAWRFGLVQLARLQHDHAAQAVAANGIASALGLVAFPLFAGMAAAAPDLVRTLLGDAFGGMALPLSILAVQTIMQMARTHTGLLVAARGWPRLNLYPTAATAVAVVVATLLIPMQTSAQAALVWTACWLVTLPVSVVLAAHRGGVGFAQQLSPNLRSGAISLVIGMVVALLSTCLPSQWSSLQRLIVLVSAGAVVYVPICWFFARDAVVALLGPRLARARPAPRA
jgi:PST family polysaccharide transporter